MASRQIVEACSRASFSVLRGSVRALSPRSFSTTSASFNAKVPIALIAELRKHNPVSLSKAKQALAASSNDVSKALEWLREDLGASGAAKVAKLAGKTAKEGLIGVSLMGTRASLVEVRCETDFVARNDVFSKLVANVAHTSAFLDLPGSVGVSSEGSATIHEAGDQQPAADTQPNPSNVTVDPLVSFPTTELLAAPIIPAPNTASLQASASAGDAAPTPSPETIQQAITAAVTQTGENIQLHRALTFASPIPIVNAAKPSSSSNQPFLLPGVYVHGAIPGGTGNEGTIGAMVILASSSVDGSQKHILDRIGDEPQLGGELQKLVRALARQVVGFPTRFVSRNQSTEGDRSEAAPSVDSAEILLEQPFMMFGGESRSVGEVLESWGLDKGVKLEITAMRRWSVGEDESSS